MRLNTLVEQSRLYYEDGSCASPILNRRKIIDAKRSIFSRFVINKYKPKNKRQQIEFIPNVLREAT